MKLPRVRVTVRGLMVLVAVAGLLVSFAVLVQRRAYYRLQMAMYRDAEEASLEMVRATDRRLEQIETASRPGQTVPEVDTLRTYNERVRAQAEYYEELVSKYRRAADRPWLPVAPDPPAPK
jgi:hypothetical protein